jgi:hypothetical protein
MGRPRKPKEEKEEKLEVEHLNLPKPIHKPGRTGGSNNHSRQLNPDGTRKGGFKSGQAPVETLESYKTWMTVQGYKRTFLVAYSECGNIIIACNITGIHPRNVSAWRAFDPVFKEDFEVATDMAVSLLEQEARRRALEGSDRLLEFLLKSIKPEVYRERYEFKQEITTDYVIDISPIRQVEDANTDTSGSDGSSEDLSREPS